MASEEEDLLREEELCDAGFAPEEAGPPTEEDAVLEEEDLPKEEAPQEQVAMEPEASATAVPGTRLRLRKKGPVRPTDGAAEAPKEENSPGAKPEDEDADGAWPAGKPTPMMKEREQARATAEAAAQEAKAFNEGLDPEKKDANQMVYLVTLAASLPDSVDNTGTPLRRVQDATREEVRDAILDAVANPVRGDQGAGRPREAPVTVTKGLVACEPPGPHFHVALRLSTMSRWLAAKRALRQRSGFASHWSASHTASWSAFRYLTHVTAKKPVVDEAPLAFTHDGSTLDLHAESQEPFIAQIVKRKREKAEASSVEQTVRFTRLDFTALVLADGLKTKEQVMCRHS
jgi:hypothetical protein